MFIKLDFRHIAVTSLQKKSVKVHYINRGGEQARIQGVGIKASFDPHAILETIT